MKKINVDFPIYSISNFVEYASDKKEVVDSVLSNRQYADKNMGFNYPLLDDHIHFFQFLYDNFYNLCLTHFNFTVNEHKNKSLCWAYVSNRVDFIEVWHNHLNSSTINGVYYLSVPNNNTSIDFSLNEKQLTYCPKENELIIFPNYLDHKPNRCYDEGYRIAINMEIICNETSDELFRRQ